MMLSIQLDDNDVHAYTVDVLLIACIIHVFASRSRTPITITSAHCPNKCLYQFGARSVQPFSSLWWICGAVRTFARAERAPMRTHDHRSPYLLPNVPMSVCANVGLDWSRRLAAYAGYVVLRARLRVQCVHQCALEIADPPISSHSSNECYEKYNIIYISYLHIQ
jgi:hypothetical protein